jgi:hypothetical protein
MNVFVPHLRSWCELMIRKMQKSFAAIAIFLREQVFWSAFNMNPVRHWQVYEFTLLTQMCWQLCPWGQKSAEISEKQGCDAIVFSRCLLIDTLKQQR